MQQRSKIGDIDLTELKEIRTEKSPMVVEALVSKVTKHTFEKIRQDHSNVVNTPAFQVLEKDIKEFIANSLDAKAATLSVYLIASKEKVGFDLEDNGLGVTKKYSATGEDHLLYSKLLAQDSIAIDALTDDPMQRSVRSEKEEKESFGRYGHALLRGHKFLSDNGGSICFIRKSELKEGENIPVTLRITSDPTPLKEQAYTEFQEKYAGNKVTSNVTAPPDTTGLGPVSPVNLAKYFIGAGITSTTNTIAPLAPPPAPSGGPSLDSAENKGDDLSQDTSTDPSFRPLVNTSAHAALTPSSAPTLFSQRTGQSLPSIKLPPERKLEPAIAFSDELSDSQIDELIEKFTGNVPSGHTKKK